jgi:hypothetical protein
MFLAKAFQAAALSLALLPSTGLALSATLWTAPIGEPANSNCGQGFRSKQVLTINRMLDFRCYWHDRVFTSVEFRNADFSDAYALYAIGPATIDHPIVDGESGDSFWVQRDPCRNRALVSGTQFNGCSQFHRDTALTGGWVMALACIDSILTSFDRGKCRTFSQEHAKSSSFNPLINRYIKSWLDTFIKRREANETVATEAVCDLHQPKPDNCVPLSSRRDSALITCVEGFETWTMPEGDEIVWHSTHPC